jgi:hypothetical protein
MVVFAFPESTFLFLGFALAAFPRECANAVLRASPSTCVVIGLPHRQTKFSVMRTCASVM